MGNEGNPKEKRATPTTYLDTHSISKGRLIILSPVKDIIYHYLPHYLGGCTILSQVTLLGDTQQLKIDVLFWLLLLYSGKHMPSSI